MKKFIKMKGVIIYSIKLSWRNLLKDGMAQRIQQL